jgi:hypothetical protein
MPKWEKLILAKLFLILGKLTFFGKTIKHTRFGKTFAHFGKKIIPKAHLSVAYLLGLGLRNKLRNLS